MAYAQSGSEEAAGLAASMAEAINSGNTEAVAALADTVGAGAGRQGDRSGGRGGLADGLHGADGRHRAGDAGAPSTAWT